MPESTITSKGQTTIPIAIRTYLGVHEGDKLEFVIDSDGRVFVTALTADVSELKGILPKPKKKITIDDMNKAVSKRGAKS